MLKLWVEHSVRGIHVRKTAHAPSRTDPNIGNASDCRKQSAASPPRAAPCAEAVKARV